MINIDAEEAGGEQMSKAEAVDKGEQTLLLRVQMIEGDKRRICRNCDGDLVL